MMSAPTPALPPGKRRRSPVRLAGLFLALACISLSALQGWSIYSTRRDALGDASVATLNMARAMADHAEGVFDQVDTVLAGVAEQIEHDGLGADQARLRDYLVATAARTPALQGLFIYDADGRWLQTSLDRPLAGPPPNNGDREYFDYHRRHPGAATHIGVPLRSRSSGIWVIPVSRRLQRADGSFAGVLLATIKHDYFRNYYERFDIGDEGVIVLGTDDGRLIMRRPFDAADIGRDAPAAGGDDGARPAAGGDGQRSGATRVAGSAAVGAGSAGGDAASVTRPDTGGAAGDRAPGSSAAAGAAFPAADTPFQRWQGQRGGGINVEGASAATAAVEADGIDRHYSYEHLRNYPLVLGVGLSRREVLARWRTSTYAGAAGAGALLVVLLALGLAMMRQLMLRDRLQQELRTAKHELEASNLSLQEMALSDGLTGLPNRRHFDQRLELEFKRAIRDGTSLALIMLDVDYFKRYNDRCGHVEGDACLQAVAGAIESSLRRAADLAARFGGEEFTILLPDTDAAGALAVAEAARQALAARELAHPASPLHRVTLSAGVAVIQPQRQQQPRQLVEAADHALYEAKGQGRNRAVAAPTVAAAVGGET